MTRKSRLLPTLKTKRRWRSPLHYCFTNRDIYAGVSNMGLHYAITCNEFVSRIRPEEVEPATRGKFLDSCRVRD